MPTTTLSCPECRAVLRPTKPVPPGAKIKCPKCAHIFTPTLAKPATNTAIQDKSRRPAPATTQAEEEESGWELVEEEEPELPIAKKSRRARVEERDEDEDEDDELDERARRRSRVPRARAIEDDEDDYQDEDEEDHQDDEDEPLPRRKGRRRQKVTAGSLIKFYLLMAALMLLVLVGASAAGVYLYLNAGRNRGTGNEDPLAYVPADSEAVMGMDVAALRSQPGLVASVDTKLVGALGNDFFQNLKKETGLEMADVSEHAIFASKPVRPGAQTGTPWEMVILQSKTPFSQRKVKNSLSNPHSEKIKGKTVYRVAVSKMSTLFMPSDRLIVLTNAPDTALEQIAGSDGTTLQVSAETGNMIRNVSKNQWWAVAPVPADAKRETAKQLKNPPATMRPFVPFLKYFNKSQTLGFGLGVDSAHVSLELDMDFEDATTAKHALEEAEGIWNREVKNSLGTQVLLNAVPKGVSACLKEAFKAMTFSHQDKLARASTQVSNASFMGLVRDGGSKFKFMMPGQPGVGPGGGFLPLPGPD